MGYLVSALTGICLILMIFLFITNSLSKKRKHILFAMVFATMTLTLMEMMASVYSGDTTVTGVIITRICKFMHYELNLVNIYIFRLYLEDMLKVEGKIKQTPKSLKVADFVLLAGAITIVISQFTGIYYTYDLNNVYHRGRYYGISYVYSTVAIAIIAINVIKNQKIFSKKLFWPFLMFTLAPIVASIIHLFYRGISLVNTTVVAMTILLYCFTILDANEVTEKAREKEMKNIKLMVSQTAAALAEAIDAKDSYTNGHSRRVAEYSAQIAKAYGKEIPEIARIIAVADTYDAMNSKRSYRDGLPKEVIRNELIKGMHTQFDAVFAAIMVDLMDKNEV